LESVSSEEILTFLIRLSQGNKQATKRTRYATLSAFFSFIKSTYAPEMRNPCDSSLLKKPFRAPKYNRWKFLEKETVDELVFKIPDTRDRLMVELITRGGLRVSEVLNLTARDVDDRKLILRKPKSGKEIEIVFIPQKIANRLKEYIRENRFEPADRVFPIGYAGARIVVKRAGMRVGINLSPHDLRRHAATYASRSGTPIEIVSKIILRHANLSTTQRYLGKVSDEEPMRWIEQLYS